MCRIYEGARNGMRSIFPTINFMYPSNLVLSYSIRLIAYSGGPYFVYPNLIRVANKIFLRFSVSEITKLGKHTMHKYTKIRGPLFCNLRSRKSKLFCNFRTRKLYKIRGPTVSVIIIMYSNTISVSADTP